MIWRMVALPGGSSCLGVGPAGVGMSASRANYVIVSPSELGNYKIADKSAATAMRSLTGDAILPCSARLNSETPSVQRLCRTAVPRVLALTD